MCINRQCGETACCFIELSIRFPVLLPRRFKAPILSPGTIRFKTVFLSVLIYSLLEFTYQICLLAVRARSSHCSHYTFWKFSSLNKTKYIKCNADTFLISNFRLVLYVVCFLLGNSPAPECYMPTFRYTLFHLPRRVGV